ncbi:MAG: hypothetical protein WEB88_11150 [Gemmatimonadota bacterium]
MTRSIIGLLAVFALLPACEWVTPDRPDLTLPPVDSVRAVYAREGMATQEIDFNGNVVEITVQQRPDDLQRGGSLWARVGPYIYLFTPGTRELFLRWEGIAGVRVITQVGGREVARALLLRTELEDQLWHRSLNLVGRAMQEGTVRPSRLEELVRWGEERTEYEYNPEFVSRPGSE